MQPRAEGWCARRALCSVWRGPVLVAVRQAVGVRGVGPAAQVAAYHAAGVPLRRLAEEFELSLVQVGQLVLGFWLHRWVAAGLVLVDGGDELCMVQDCSKPRDTHRLCWTHLSRFYHRRPALRPHSKAKVQTCVVCGAQWCRLRPGKTVTCGSPDCLAVRRRTPVRNPEVNAAILARVAAGEPYRDIAADYGVTPARISQLANRMGRYRRAPRGPLQREARERRRQALARYPDAAPEAAAGESAGSLGA